MFVYLALNIGIIAVWKQTSMGEGMGFAIDEIGF